MLKVYNKFCKEFFILKEHKIWYLGKFLKLIRNLNNNLL